MLLVMEDMLVPNTSAKNTDWICKDCLEISMRSIALVNMLVVTSWRRFTDWICKSVVYTLLLKSYFMRYCNDVMMR